MLIAKEVHRNKLMLTDATTTENDLNSTEKRMLKASFTMEEFMVKHGVTVERLDEYEEVEIE